MKASEQTDQIVHDLSNAQAPQQAHHRQLTSQLPMSGQELGLLTEQQETSPAALDKLKRYITPGETALEKL